ncbi:U-scoloptoxin(05)-Sm1a-like [Anneissia japonica]|uniref:U-scoloptoxin(05)-Sm1a-like n=1 Tax=Anneissia japonica TaxID=1529436 RepID=UPI001425868E|nr:U-scoloptoxin(05)-Sm1a-like [Anneissia japonica]
MTTSLKMSLNIWIVLATLTCIAVIANGLTCYQCSNCGDPFSSEGIDTVNCTTDKCFKSKAEVLGIENVERGCGAYTEGCSEVLGIKVCYHVCEKDKCNGATITTVTSTMFLVACAIAHLI